jgi:hypothetical protein
MEECLNKLEETLNELAEAQIARERYWEALELSRATALLSGIISGKNSEEREA